MDTIDYTVPVHAYERGLPYAEIEIRQDLLADQAGVSSWSHRLEQALNYALETYATR
jgi:predicted N-formylglutamate amidohydrolase